MRGLLAAAVFCSAITAAANAPPAPSPYAAIEGEWSVDLRPTFADPVYSKAMVLRVSADRKVTGSFYDSEILAGQVGKGQDRLCVAFRTTDGEGFYHSSACLLDGKMVGMTWSEGRNFVLPWTATRK